MERKFLLDCAYFYIISAKESENVLYSIWSGIRKYKHGRKLTKNGKRRGSAYKSPSRQARKGKWITKNHAELVRTSSLGPQLSCPVPTYSKPAASIPKPFQGGAWSITATRHRSSCPWCKKQRPTSRPLPIPAGVHTTAVSWGEKSTLIYKSATGLLHRRAIKSGNWGGGLSFGLVEGFFCLIPWFCVNDGNFSAACSAAEGGTGTPLHFSIKSSYREQGAAASPSPARRSSHCKRIQMPRRFRERYGLNGIDLCPLYRVLQRVCMLWIHLYTYSLTSAPTRYLDQRYLKATSQWPITRPPLLLYNMQPIRDLSAKLPGYQNNKTQLARWHLGGIQFASFVVFFLFVLCVISFFPLVLILRSAERRK